MITIIENGSPHGYKSRAHTEQHLPHWRDKEQPASGQAAVQIVADWFANVPKPPPWDQSGFRALIPNSASETAHGAQFGRFSPVSRPPASIARQLSYWDSLVCGISYRADAYQFLESNLISNGG